MGSATNTALSSLSASRSAEWHVSGAPREPSVFTTYLRARSMWPCRSAGAAETRKDVVSWIVMRQQAGRPNRPLSQAPCPTNSPVTRYSVMFLLRKQAVHIAPQGIVVEWVLAGAQGAVALRGLVHTMVG